MPAGCLSCLRTGPGAGLTTVLRDKAFSWEKVAPKGPDVGRYQPSKWEVAGIDCRAPLKTALLVFEGRQSFSQPATAPHPPPSGAPSPRRGLDSAKQQFIAQPLGLLTSWLPHWGSCRRLRGCTSERKDTSAGPWDTPSGSLRSPPQRGGKAQFRIPFTMQTPCAFERHRG